MKFLFALGAAGLVALSTQLPLWRMTMKAPQYPKGLHVEAFGSGMVGDLRELNILNHYIGALPLDPQPAFETAMYPWAIGGVILLCLLAPVHRWVRRLAIVGTASAPFIMMADIQWRLYQFGHTMNPKAPIRLKPFTPLVIGESTLGNFHATGMIATGALCLFGAAALLLLAGYLERRQRAARALYVPGAIAAALALAIVAPSHATPAPIAGLQARLDAAARGTALTLEPGIYQGPIVVRGPLHLVGTPGTIIDGGGSEPAHRA